MTAIPCKRPDVRIQANGLTETQFARCYVPGCNFAYGPALKTDAEENAKRHRHAHRDAVPATSIRHDLEYDVYCEPCGGHRRTFGTRTDAQAWLDYHLSAEHGLVSCS